MLHFGRTLAQMLTGARPIFFNSSLHKITAKSYCHRSRVIVCTRSPPCARAALSAARRKTVLIDRPLPGAGGPAIARGVTMLPGAARMPAQPDDRPHPGALDRETGIRRSSRGGRRNDQPPIQIQLGLVDVARAAVIAFGGL
jgi:hypothetical protein